METAKERRIAKKKKTGVGVGETKKWTYSDAVERREPEKKKKGEKKWRTEAFRFLFSEARHFSYPSPSFPRKGRKIGGKEEEKGVSDGT